MTFDWQELIGYIASALVVTSLAMTSVVRLRMFSLAGSIAFVTYGSLIGSIPIMITNTAIAGLNIWFLSRELRGHRDLGAVVVPTDSPFLVDFLAHRAEEITTFQPDYSRSDDPDTAIILTRDGLPAGVVLGARRDSTLDISLDFVLPAYRDSRLGRWLYGAGSDVFDDLGIERVATSGGNESHRSYLERVGFGHDTGTNRWTRDV